MKNVRSEDMPDLETLYDYENTTTINVKRYGHTITKRFQK